MWEIEKYPLHFDEKCAKMKLICGECRRMTEVRIKMYAVGDKIIYGSSGVCVVTEICTPNFSREERGRQYYKLRPVYGTETIYAPVNTAAFMRPVMTRQEAEELIARIPQIAPSVCDSRSVTVLRQQYEAFFRSHDCEACIRLVKGVHTKGLSGKKLGQTDQKYKKRAEEILHGELAVALDISPEQVPEYIREAMELV